MFNIEINGRILNDEKVSEIIHLDEKDNNICEISMNSNNDLFYYNNRYAVIIVGYYGDEQHYGWYTYDAQRQYNVLTEIYNFNDSNIYILLNLKDEWLEHLKIDPEIIDYNSTEENIIMIFDELKSKLTKNDLLYIVIINHGGDNHNINLFGRNIDFWQGIFAHDTFFGLEKSNNYSKYCYKILQNSFFHFNKSEIDNRVYDHDLGW